MSRFGAWKTLRPVHFERIDFRGTNIAGEQGRIVGRKSKPVHERSGGHGSDILGIHYVFDFAVANPGAVITTS
jgi:hypothetical protein